MRLPPPYQDLEAAENYLRKGLEISPGSSFGNHAMAMFFEKYKQVILIFVVLVFSFILDFYFTFIIYRTSYHTSFFKKQFYMSNQYFPKT